MRVSSSWSHPSYTYMNDVEKGQSRGRSSSSRGCAMTWSLLKHYHHGVVDAMMRGLGPSIHNPPEEFSCSNSSIINADEIIPFVFDFFCSFRSLFRPNGIHRSPFQTMAVIAG